MSTPGLSYWYEQIFGPELFPEDAVVLMQQQPDFAQACVACARGNLALRSTNPALARAFRDSARSFYAMFAVILDARGPVTLASLQALSAQFGFASRGRAAAMMMYLRMIGYLEPSPQQTDRRSRSYAASPKLIAIHDQFIANEIAAAATIEPELRPVLARLHEPAVRNAYLRQLGIGLMRLLRTAPQPTSLFADRDAGLAILYQLALGGEDGDTYPARGPVRLSLSACARQHGVSRSHVSRLLRDAVAADLLREAGDGAWILQERLRVALSRLHAYSFVGHAALAYYAVKLASEGAAPAGGRPSAVGGIVPDGLPPAMAETPRFT
jgi:hypothetical protein